MDTYVVVGSNVHLWLNEDFDGLYIIYFSW